MGGIGLLSLILFSVKNKVIGLVGVSQRIECLPAMHEALGSTPDTTKSRPGMVVCIGKHSTQEDQKFRASLY